MRVFSLVFCFLLVFGVVIITMTIIIIIIIHFRSDEGMLSDLVDDDLLPGSLASPSAMPMKNMLVMHTSKFSDSPPVEWTHGMVDDNCTWTLTHVRCVCVCVRNNNTHVAHCKIAIIWL